MEVAFKLKEVQDLGLPLAAGDFVVSGMRSYDGWFLKADRLVFKPDAKLVFSRTALSNRRQFFIVARELVVEDGGRPGTITWERGPNPGVPGGMGQAATAGSATSEGQPGAGGASGASGVEGVAGESAPSLTILLLAVPSSGPLVDISGQVGGPGGQGQKGGSGGVGGWGNPASQSAFDCRRGAGNGAQGGGGGNGGQGGVGGHGGNGGTVTLVSDASLLGTLSQRFRVTVGGGDGGRGGDGGAATAAPVDMAARKRCPGAGATVLRGLVGTAGRMDPAGPAAQPVAPGTS